MLRHAYRSIALVILGSMLAMTIVFVQPRTAAAQVSQHAAPVVLAGCGGSKMYSPIRFEVVKCSLATPPFTARLTACPSALPVGRAEIEKIKICAAPEARIATE